MQNIVLTTRLTSFGCLSLLLAGYGLWVNHNISQNFSLKDILLNKNFKSNPFVDYHDYFPTEEDIAKNMINNDFLDDIAHIDEQQYMVETTDHYDELFEAPNFVTITPQRPIIEVYFQKDPLLIKPTPPIITAQQKPRLKENNNLRPDFPQIIAKKPIKTDSTSRQKVQKDTPSGLSAIEQAIQELSRSSDAENQFIAPQKREQQKNTVKTNYFSLYRPQTDLDETFILPISDAVQISEADQTKKRDRFKKDIANIYDKRRLQTLKAREYNKKIDKNIAEINKLLKQIGISLEKKFYAHKHDISKHKSLTDINVLPEDLVFRFPSLYSSLQKAQSLKIALSFIPTAPPVRAGRISSNYGWRKDPFHKKSRFHSGMDFAAVTGTPIYSPASGTVKFVGWKGGYGKTIEIYHGNGITTRYAHLSRFNVKKGQKIVQFSKIGAIGSTGRSTGPHLHYEIMKGNKKVNPKIFTSKNKKIVNIIKEIK